MREGVFHLGLLRVFMLFLMFLTGTLDVLSSGLRVAVVSSLAVARRVRACMRGI
jgi:hypothetical protein